MRRLIVTAALSALALFVVAGAFGAPANLKSFGSESGSEVTVLTSSSATIVNEAGGYGGVYVQGKSLQGKSLAKADFAFTAAGVVAGGAPRFSIPINDGAFDPNADYAFLDVANCGGTLVSTEDASCKVYFGNDVFANWDDFAAKRPDYKIASAIPFIIADQAGSYTVSGIDLH